MIPDTERGRAFALLLVMGTLQILAKGSAVALLAITNTNWLLPYMIIDVAILLVYKLVRRDFLTWHPLPFAISVPFSFFMRVVTKVILDFSGGLIARLPGLLGGAYFSFNTVQTQVSVLVAVHVYNKYAEDSEESAKIDATTTWTVAVVAISLWALTFAFFYFRVCVPRYRKTFYSTETGHQAVMNSFLNSTEDDIRMGIFVNNRESWRDIEDEVRDFTHMNWRRWVETNPEWFTAAVIASVPDEFIPAEERALLGGGKRKRRASAVGSVRESVRGI